ncbi:MAG: GNAT family protein [Sulfuritalea sp.]|nr:GNAT family protein [Sulfuritalea sp.]
MSLADMHRTTDFFARVALQGKRVRLEPLTLRHVDDLAQAGADAAIWQWLPTAHDAPGTMETFIRAALAQQALRKAVPFATIDAASSSAVGSTRYHFIEPEQLRLEIGFTWVSSLFQRSHVNTEAKFLQLWYAFEVLGCRRVEFKADAENFKSRAAILRLGAKEEGLFRKHMIYPDGRNRDSVYFAMLDDEWADAKAFLLSRLAYDPEPRVIGAREAVPNTSW